MRMKRQGLLALFASMAWAQPLPHPGKRVTCQNVEFADVTVIRAPKPPRTSVGVLRSGFNAHFNVGILIGSQRDNTQALVSVTYGRRVPRNRRELYYEEGFFLRYSKGPARRSPKTYLTTVHYDDQWPGAGVVTAAPPRPTSADVGATRCTLEPGPAWANPYTDNIGTVARAVPTTP
jgi:hypothetical protein